MVETLNAPETTPKPSASAESVSDTKKEVASILSSPNSQSIEKAMEKNFDAHEWLMDDQLGGFSQKEYDKIHKEQGPKAASEYAAAATKKKEEKTNQESKPSEKIETKREEKPQEKQQPDSKPETKKENTKPQGKPQEKKQDLPKPKEKKEKKPWNLWGKFKTLAKESKNLVSYPFRAGRSTVKYLTFDWYDHGLGKKELGSQWEKFKKKIVWNYKK